eukprot:341560-Pleurochrysis_carterae.AAC.2
MPEQPELKGKFKKVNECETFAYHQLAEVLLKAHHFLPLLGRRRSTYMLIATHAARAIDLNVV